MAAQEEVNRLILISISSSLSSSMFLCRPRHVLDAHRFAASKIIIVIIITCVVILRPMYDDRVTPPCCIITHQILILWYIYIILPITITLKLERFYNVRLNAVDLAEPSITDEKSRCEPGGIILLSSCRRTGKHCFLGSFLRFRSLADNHFPITRFRSVTMLKSTFIEQCELLTLRPLCRTG